MDVASHGCSEKFFDRTEKCVMLFIVLKAITSIFTVIMACFRVYCDDDIKSIGPLTKLLISLFFTLNAVIWVMKLVHLAHATMAARGLEGKSHSKLWSIKGLVKVILIQSLIVGFIWKPFLLKRFFRPTQDWNGVELKKAVQNILVLIQLITFAVIQMRAFDYRVYSHMEIQHKPARNCCFGRSKAEEPIDEGYRSLLNHKDRHAFTALQALIHALEPTELRGSQTPI